MTLLATHGLTAHYRLFQALFGVDIPLEPAETLATIGANGAGKSTLMRAVTGLLPSAPGQVVLDGRSRGASGHRHGARRAPAVSLADGRGEPAHRRAGPQAGRLLGARHRVRPASAAARAAPGTAFSDGQQHMVAIGRAPMSNPRGLLCDEISLGLAPVVIVVEQDIGMALKIAGRLCCLTAGRGTLAGRPGEVTRAAIHAAHFGAMA